MEFSTFLDDFIPRLPLKSSSRDERGISDIFSRKKSPTNLSIICSSSTFRNSSSLGDSQYRQSSLYIETSTNIQMKKWLLFFSLIGLAWSSLDAPSESVPNDQTIPPAIAAAEDDPTHSTMKADVGTETTVAANSSQTLTTASPSSTSKMASTTPGLHPVLPSFDPTDSSIHRDQPSGGPSQPTDGAGAMSGSGSGGTSEETSSTSTQGAATLPFALSIVSLMLAYLF